MKGMYVMNMGKNVLFVAACVFLWCSTVAAEYVIDLTPIVVTGTRLIESPSSLESIVLDADEKVNQGISDLGEALRSVQGVDVYSSSFVSGAGAVSIRGADSAYTQVMYNGIKLFDPMSTTQYFSGYHYVPLSAFEKIKVLKGPYSALYGSGGIGGNIHLISQRGHGRPSGIYRQEIGSYQTFRETLKFQGETGALDYALHASREDIGGMYAASYQNGNHETDPLGTTALGMRLDYDVTDAVTIGAMGDFFHSRYEYDGSSWVPPYNPVDDDSNVEKNGQGVGMIYVEHRMSEEFQQKWSLGGNRIYRKGQDSGADFWFDGSTRQMKYDGMLDLVSWDTVSFGADYLEEEGEFFYSTYSPKSQAHTKGVFVQNRLEPVDGSRVVTGARWEKHSVFGHDTTYSIRGEQDVFEDGTFYVSYGTGFKAPSLYQLFDPSYGSVNLDPERSRSYEFGYDYQMKQMSFGQAFFLTDIEDMINWTWSGYENAGQVKIRGIEWYTQYRLINQASLRAEYTYQETETKSTGARLARRPENKLTLAGEFPWKKFLFRADVSYVGNRIDAMEKLKAYYLANFSAEYQVQDYMKAFIRVENIFNENYEMAFGYATPDCSVYSGFELKF